MKEELQHLLLDKPTMSPSTIGRTLDGMLRTRYASRVRAVAHAVRSCRPLRTRQCFGRAPHCIPARRVVHAQRGRNCNMTSAVSGEIGLVNHNSRNSPWMSKHVPNRWTSLSYVRQCQTPCVCAQLPAGLNQQIQLQRLPPYSPFLNMTEMAPSSFQAGVI